MSSSDRDDLPPAPYTLICGNCYRPPGEPYHENGYCQRWKFSWRRLLFGRRKDNV